MCFLISILARWVSGVGVVTDVIALRCVQLGKLEAAGHLKPPPEMASERTAATTIYIRVRKSDEPLSETMYTHAYLQTASSSSYILYLGAIVNCCPLRRKLRCLTHVVLGGACFHVHEERNDMKGCVGA